jgi:hypothetical protein
MKHLEFIGVNLYGYRIYVASSARTAHKFSKLYNTTYHKDYRDNGDHCFVIII